MKEMVEHEVSTVAGAGLTCTIIVDGTSGPTTGTPCIYVPITDTADLPTSQQGISHG